MKRLTKEFKNIDPDALCDYLSVIACDVEDAMMQSGAEPGKDYAILDLFKLAVTLVASERVGKKKD